MNIRNLKVCVLTHKHQPGIPSAQEIEQKPDVDLSEMNKLFLPKWGNYHLYRTIGEKNLGIEKNKVGASPKKICSANLSCTIARHSLMNTYTSGVDTLLHLARSAVDWNIITDLALSHRMM